MTYKELKDFLESKMRLSHIYQPLLIKSLVEAGGKATIRQLALVFITEDEGLIQDYEKRLKQMPIKVLGKHKIIERDGDLVTLNVEKLSLTQKSEIGKICEQKLREYISARGLSVWDYRFLDETTVSDSLRLRVLQEAKGRCALCGATRDQYPLDVDHIIPRSLHGKTEYANLQVLCSKCNRSKRNKDKTDFRNILGQSVHTECIFCEPVGKREVIIENEFAYATPDGYPVTQGHTLFIPKRHIGDYFNLSERERSAINELLIVRRKQLFEVDKSILGFNIGANCGETAGQSIMHCHVHLIPRRKNDTPNPRGGVRGVIPNKMNYQ